MIRVGRQTIEIFGLSIHWYGVLIVTGIALAILLAWKREREYDLPKDTVLDLALWCIPAAIVGARAYYVIFAWDEFSAAPWWQVLNIRAGGMAIYGGVIAGVLTGWIFARRRKLSFWKLADLVAPCIPLGQAIGRWGNFVNQEAHGALVVNEALHFFPMSVEIGGQWYYATFFYESAWCFLIVIFLLNAQRKRWFRCDGDAFSAYVFLYALERSIVEGMRADSLYLGPMRVSQLLSIAAMIAVAAVWIARNKFNGKRDEKQKNRGE